MLEGKRLERLRHACLIPRCKALVEAPIPELGGIRVTRVEAGRHRGHSGFASVDHGGLNLRMQTLARTGQSPRPRPPPARISATPATNDSCVSARAGSCA